MAAIPPKAFFSIWPSSVSLDIISTSVFESSAIWARSSMMSVLSAIVNAGDWHFGQGFPVRLCSKL